MSSKLGGVGRLIHLKLSLVVSSMFFWVCFFLRGLHRAERLLRHFITAARTAIGSGIKMQLSEFLLKDGRTD